MGRVSTWDQLNFNGQAIRFHSETIGTIRNTWECPDPDSCDDCHNYDQENKQ